MASKVWQVGSQQWVFVDFFHYWSIVDLHLHLIHHSQMALYPYCMKQIIHNFVWQLSRSQSEPGLGKYFIQDFFTHLTIWAQHHFFWPWKTHKVVWIMSPPSQCFFPHSNKCFLTTIHEVCLSGMFLFSVWVATFLTFSVLHVGSYYCYDNPAALEKTIEQVGS